MTMIYSHEVIPVSRAFVRTVTLRIQHQNIILIPQPCLCALIRAYRTLVRWRARTAPTQSLNDLKR
jgi:hypothetical protein